MTVTNLKKRNAAAAAAVTESGRSKFLRLAEKRTGNAIKYIHLIGNLGAGGYESTEDERQQIFDALTEAVEVCKTRLEQRTKEKPTFEFR